MTFFKYLLKGVTKQFNNEKDHRDKMVLVFMSPQALSVWQSVDNHLFYTFYVNKVEKNNFYTIYVVFFEIINAILLILLCNFASQERH